MTRRLIPSGSSFEKLAGYSRAVVDGDWVFVSGTTGFDYATGAISPDVVEQTRQIFRTFETVLADAGATLADTVRVRAFLAEAGDFALVAPVFSEYLGDIRPANTTVVAGFTDPRMKIEIELTARIGGGSV
jgi:enamine deaminase RidA (YjgF/YER057c/UK114 family)